MRLRTRIGNFREETHIRGGIHLTFVTTYGLKANAYSSNVRNEVTMDDLFKL